MSYGSLGFTILAAVAKIVFMILGFLMPLASILTWLERRQSAMMQDRLGPNRANIPLPGGFYTVDEGARLIIFSPYQVHDVVEGKSKKNQIVFTQEPPARPTEEFGKVWQPLQFGKQGNVVVDFSRHEIARGEVRDREAECFSDRVNRREKIVPFRREHSFVEVGARR